MQNFDKYLEEQFQDKHESTAFINAALDQYFEDHNKELFLATLKEAIKLHGGITEISKQTHINRQHLYRMLSNKGNPSFDNIGSLLTALGLKLKVEYEKKVVC